MEKVKQYSKIRRRIKTVKRKINNMNQLEVLDICGYREKWYKFKIMREGKNLDIDDSIFMLPHVYDAFS